MIKYGIASMSKKIYMKPTMQCIEMALTNVLCTSMPGSDKFHKVDSYDTEQEGVSNNPYDAIRGTYCNSYNIFVGVKTPFHHQKQGNRPN